jgi:hypothetical protein
MTTGTPPLAVMTTFGWTTSDRTTTTSIVVPPGCLIALMGLVKQSVIGAVASVEIEQLAETFSSTPFCATASICASETFDGWNAKFAAYAGAVVQLVPGEPHVPANEPPPVVMQMSGCPHAGSPL